MCFYRIIWRRFARVLVCVIALVCVTNARSVFDHHKSYFIYGGDIGGGLLWMGNNNSYGADLAGRLEYVHYGKGILGWNVGGGLQWQPGLSKLWQFVHYINFQLFGGIVFLVKVYEKRLLKKIDIRADLLYNPLIKDIANNNGFKIKTIGCGGGDFSLNFLFDNGVYLGAGVQLVNKLASSENYTGIWWKFIPRRYIAFFKMGWYTDLDAEVDDFLLDEEIDFDVG